MRKKTTFTPCLHCNGKGKIKISEEAQATLNLFDHRNSLTALQAHNKIGQHVTINALNRRLEWLRKQTLLDRERRGRWYHYFRPRKEEAPPAQP